MNSDKKLIHYACISKGSTILAEFNSKDADLGDLALKCLHKTPSHHSIFSHTIRDRRYLFLIDQQFSYFAIFNQDLENSEGLSFLRNVKDAFIDIADNSSDTTLTSHCFQGEFNPVFHRLLPSPEEFQSPDSGHNRTGISSDTSADKPSRDDNVNCLKKKKRFLFGGCVERSNTDDTNIKMSRELSVVTQKNGGGGGVYNSGELGSHQKGKKIWKKQVCVVLSMDLIICTILFVIWLYICNGFKCMYL